MPGQRHAYLDFGLRIYHEMPTSRNSISNRKSGNAFQSCYSSGHGATATETMRIPFWLWEATGNSEYLRLGRASSRR